MAVANRVPKALLVIALVLVILGGGLSRPASAAGYHLALDASLACVPGGGVIISYTVRNTGNETAYLNDLHFYLTKMISGGPEGGGIVFLFPSPDYAVIPQGSQGRGLSTSEPPFLRNLGKQLTCRRIDSCSRPRYGATDTTP